MACRWRYWLEDDGGGMRRGVLSRGEVEKAEGRPAEEGRNGILPLGCLRAL